MLLTLCAVPMMRSIETAPKPDPCAREPHPSDALRVHLDTSGCPRVGVASYYAHSFAGHTMADGTPMRPAGNNAASLTLPLGTVAQVTNLSTGKSAVVTIRDRGPYVRGRILDLSPGTAHKIGISRREGLAKVAVVPLAMPVPATGVAAGALRSTSAGASARARTAARARRTPRYDDAAPEDVRYAGR